MSIPSAAEPWKPKFAGMRVFKVKPDAYSKFLKGKKKNSHWEPFLRREDASDIREYIKRNPKKKIVLQDEQYGTMFILQRDLQYAMFFLSMFKGAKIYLVLAIIGILTGGWFYMQRLQANIDTLKINNSKLSTAVDSKDGEIKRLNANIVEVKEINTRIQSKSAELRLEVTGLRDKLSKHDLGFLAANKPALIENIINMSRIKQVGGLIGGLFNEKTPSKIIELSKDNLFKGL